MNYSKMTSKELALVIRYAEKAHHFEPALINEIVGRLDPTTTPAYRYRKMLVEGVSKVQVIKTYRGDTGCTLREAKDRIDELSASIKAPELRKCSER